MSSFRILIRNSINYFLGFFKVRVISNIWGPKGFLHSFNKIKGLGVIPDLIIDVGAARGEWSLECSLAYPDSEYLLIDPLEENRVLLETLEKNRSYKFWSGALGSEVGIQEMHNSKDQSSFLESEYNEDKNLLTVQVETLGSLLGQTYPDFSGTIFLKVDVQGYELEVLKGMGDNLKEIEVILLEVSFREIYQESPLASEVIAFMHDKGFRIYDICTYAQRPKDNELAQADILFVRSDSIIFRDESWD